MMRAMNGSEQRNGHRHPTETERPARRCTWADLGPTERMLVGAGITTQLALAATAWIDLARRPDERVRGCKSFWAVAIAVNFIGPASYFLIGRRR
jgi:hypothetical protein